MPATQTAVMLAFGAGALELWGLSAAAGSAHAEGLAFLQLKALGMPFNVITLTLQVWAWYQRGGMLTRRSSATR